MQNIMKTSNQTIFPINTIVMFPGGFKPFTEAHLDMVNRYAMHPDVSDIVLFVSPSKRDMVDAKTAVSIINNTLMGLHFDANVSIHLDMKSYSPILAVYRWIEKSERKPGKYTLASSTKDEDYKRVKDFTNNYSPEKYGKNLPKGVNIIELPIDVTPVMVNNEPISATTIRKCVNELNYYKFCECYPTLPKSKIEFIWNSLIGKNLKDM